MVAESSESGASVSKQPEPQAVEKATELFATGKRHLVCNEFPNAVQVLSETCSIYTDLYGQLADECGEPLYHYGRALLEVARMESGVLGDALDGIPEDNTDDVDDSIIGKPDDVPDEEREKISDAVIDAMCKDENEESKAKETKAEEKQNEVVPAETSETTEAKASEPTEVPKPSDSMDTAAEPAAAEPAKAEPVETKPNEAEVAAESNEAEAVQEGEDKMEDEPAEDEDDDEEEEDDKENQQPESTAADSSTAVEASNSSQNEDISNLQLAWETFETARLIFKRSEISTAKLRVADCHLRLAEVGLEKGAPQEALEDLNLCLAIQKENLPADDRSLAETYYQMGLAHQLSENYDQAVVQFELACKIVEDRYAALTRESENLQDKPEELEKVKAEIAELGALIPDIKEMIGDARESKHNPATHQVLRQAFRKSDVGFDTPSIPIDNTAPVNDVTHLVRKRKSDADVEPEAKKSKADEDATSHEDTGTQQNGDNAQKHEEVENGHKNGDYQNGNHTNGNGNHTNGIEKLKEKIAEIEETAAPQPMEATE